MKAKKNKQGLLGKSVKRSIQRLIKHPTGESPMSGFCICPNCNHLVFDSALTGSCPFCGIHFCASCIKDKYRN